MVMVADYGTQVWEFPAGLDRRYPPSVAADEHVEIRLTRFPYWEEECLLEVYLQVYRFPHEVKYLDDSNQR